MRKSRNAVGRSPASINFERIVGFLPPTCFGNCHRLPCASNECHICSFVEPTLSVAANTDSVVFELSNVPGRTLALLTEAEYQSSSFYFLAALVTSDFRSTF